jgi:uncharacterized protein with von Willebrand factor type A (vWA) domain
VIHLLNRSMKSVTEMDSQREFVRILDNQPLTLACSALADFLWEDFVRDARPTVRYLTDVYNIRQLSRFGKELFDRLYNADRVNWLVTEQAYEEYFRKVCDGDLAAIPEGYKPENGIWYSIMNDLSQAPAWFDLLQRSVGDQFNAGNNAVNILNQLSEAIEEAIEQNKFSVELLTGSGEELQKLREEFKEAQSKGDTAAANKARQKAKELVNEINEAIQEAKEKLQVDSSKIVDSVVKDHDETKEAMSTLWGKNQGERQKLMDLNKKKELASKLQKNKQLKALVKKIGSLRRVWEERKRARNTRDSYEEIAGAVFSNDLTKTFPVELALAGSAQGKALFALKYSQRALLTKEFNAQRKDLGKGPIILYVDVSGSMHGENELWSKAITFVIAEQAAKDKRDVHVHLFDTQVDSTIKLSKDRKTNQDLVDFVGVWTLGGGTSFNAVIAHALNYAEVEQNADVLMITDGHAEINDNFIKRLQKFKQQHGLQWSTICINNEIPKVCKEISDELYSVDTENQNHAVDSIQKCIR